MSDKLKIVVLDSAAIGEDLDMNDFFGKFGEVVTYSHTSPEEFAERASEADIIVQNKYKLDASSLEKARKLKLVCEAATGFDNIDVAYCREHGIGVANVPAYSTDCVAQLTLTMALNILMHMPEYTSFVSNGDYTKSGIPNKLTPQFNELCGKKWGIVGLGHIGKKVAQIASAFGCRIIACKRTPEVGYECVDIDTLCKNADIISLHTPLNDSTRSLISKKQLDEMKKNAILINVSRGAVTDEAAVAEAVISGKIAGFGCDVYSVEPFPVSHPFTKLLGLPNVCLTPHIAWGAYETRVRLLGEMAENVAAFLRNEVRNRVDIK